MALKSLAIFVVLGLVSHPATAFTCYSCGTSINSANVESNTAYPCAEITSATVSADAGTDACITTFTNEGATFKISRGVATGYPASTTGNYCTNDAGTTTCYCSSDKCNSHKVSAPRTYNCYDCSSSEYFDNGCGEKLDTSLGYVKTTVGCSACYKTVTLDTDMTLRYTRGCSRGIQVDDSCAGDVSKGTVKRCACEKNLCNSAVSQVISTSSAMVAVFLSALLKYFN